MTEVTQDPNAIIKRGDLPKLIGGEHPWKNANQILFSKSA